MHNYIEIHNFFTFIDVTLEKNYLILCLIPHDFCLESIISGFGNTKEVISDNGSSSQQNAMPQQSSCPPAVCMVAEDAQCQPLATSHSDIHTTWEYSQVLCGVYPRWIQTQEEEVDLVAVTDTWYEMHNKIANTTQSYQCL